MTRFKVGAQFHPQQCSMEDLRNGWRETDAMGVDSIWNWDHFFPLYDDRDGPHFEGWTQLAAMACDTQPAMFGAMVTCIGAGWFDRDYQEYGYEFARSSAGSEPWSQRSLGSRHGWASSILRRSGRSRSWSAAAESE